MGLKRCSGQSVRMIIGAATIFPSAVSFFRKDNCYQVEKAGGGIELRTNGSKGLEIMASGSYAPDEKNTIRTILESFVSDMHSVTVDGRSYGSMILLEGTLTEKSAELGGTYRLRMGGYEI